jgi:hypothetical protein
LPLTFQSGTHSLKPIDEGEKMTAVITEAQRFEMHTCLRGLMGEEVANTMMEHLPPSGWSDVARKSDIEIINLKITHLGKELKGLKIVIGALIPTMVAGFIGLYSALVSKL